MIDIHSHLLPGVDDGSPSIEVSVPVLQRFAADGVIVLVCTPHLNASQAAAAPYARYMEILAELRASAPAVPELRLGWEIMLDAPGVDLTPSELTLGDSRALLVEFTRGGPPPGATVESDAGTGPPRALSRLYNRSHSRVAGARCGDSNRCLCATWARRASGYGENHAARRPD
jgi:hypothetical protein